MATNPYILPTSDTELYNYWDEVRREKREKQAIFLQTPVSERYRTTTIVGRITEISEIGGERLVLPSHNPTTSAEKHRKHSSARAMVETARASLRAKITSESKRKLVDLKAWYLGGRLEGRESKEGGGK